MRLILVRHGQSEWNQTGRIIGQTDVGLTELGRVQARSVASALQAERIRAVYSSSLERALETGRIIAQSQRCPLISCPDLQELARGDLEGMTREDVLRSYPGLRETWPEVGDAFGFKGLESLKDLVSRVEPCLDLIRARHPSDTAVMVGHYFANLAIILLILEMEPRFFRSFAQDLGAISIIDIAKDRLCISLLNHTCHLPKE